VAPCQDFADFCRAYAGGVLAIELVDGAVMQILLEEGLVGLLGRT
jgi:hypothetical protein